MVENPFLKYRLMPVATSPVPQKKESSESAKKDLTSNLTSSKIVEQVPESAVANPFLQTAPTPTQQLLIGTPDEMALLPPKTVDSEINSVYELATVSTENLEPANPTKAIPNLNRKAEALTQTMALTSPESVRELCDELDRRIANDEHVDGIKLISIREHIATLMVTLRQRPEFDEIVLDKDIRNIMRVIRSTRNESLALREVKTTKKVVADAKKGNKTKLTSMMETAFLKLMKE